MKSKVTLLAALLTVAISGVSHSADKPKKKNIEGRMVYGVGAAGLWLAEAQQEDVEIKDGIVRVGRLAEHEIRPAAVISYQLSRQDNGVGYGPVLLLDFELGDKPSIGLGNVGAGFMLSFRGKDDEDALPISAFAIGLVYVIDTDGRRLRDDFIDGQVAPAPEPVFVEFTRGSVALVATVTFGKKKPRTVVQIN